MHILKSVFTVLCLDTDYGLLVGKTTGYVHSEIKGGKSDYQSKAKAAYFIVFPVLLKWGESRHEEDNR